MDASHPLSRWRDENHLSQDEFARSLGVSRWMVNAIETGRRKPSVDLSRRIEGQTGIPVASLRPDIFQPEASLQ